MIKGKFEHRFFKKVFLNIMIVSVTLVAVGGMPFVAYGGALVNGPVAGSDTSSIGNFANYGKPNLSRIWYNSRQNRWDALIPKDDGGVSASDHYILKDVLGSQIFTSVELEDRDFGRPDIFWDDANMKLYVLSSHPVSSEFWQVAYDETADNYDIVVGTAGTGQSVPGISYPNSDSPASLYVSPNGHVWVAVLQDNALQVQHSVDGGATWLASPVTLDSSVTVGVTTWIHFQNQGGTFVGVFAGENGEEQPLSEFFFWVINQDVDPSVSLNWTNDPPPASEGRERADDHVSAARDGAENLYFAVKTEGGDSSDPLIKLYKRTPDGAWSQFLVTKTGEDPERTRPSIVIDDENAEIYIYTNDAEIESSTERQGSLVKAGLSSLEGLANEPFLTVFRSPGKIFTDLLTPRYMRNPQDGIVVLAHNRTDKTIWFNSVTTSANSVNLPVIPGAAGWGMNTPAGRGGSVYRVTNLNQSGPGSFRAAIEASGPRVVVFEISGTIVLTGELHVYNPYVTIAGQTAPSPGITLKGAGLFINTHDVLVQHLRIRVGDGPDGPEFDNRDGISIDAYAQDVFNVVIDHCSVSWAVDGNIDLWNAPLHDITIRYTIISEGLRNAGHPKGSHSTGMLTGPNIKRISLNANLFAHNHDRNPLIRENTTCEFINNLIYNWYWYGTRTFAAANIIGNHFRTGPDTNHSAKGIYIQYAGKNPLLQPDTVYVSNNTGPGRPTNTGDDWLAVSGDRQFQTNTPFVQGSGITAMDTNDVYMHVLTQSGARPADRDSVDTRVVASVMDRTGRIIDSQDDVGGWPNLVQNTRTLILPNTPQGDDDGDGYTNLEEWLHSFASEVESVAAPNITLPDL